MIRWATEPPMPRCREKNMVDTYGYHAVDLFVSLSYTRNAAKHARDSARRARGLEGKAAAAGPRRRGTDRALDGRRANARVIEDDR